MQKIKKDLEGYEFPLPKSFKSMGGNKSVKGKIELENYHTPLPAGFGLDERILSVRNRKISTKARRTLLVRGIKLTSSVLALTPSVLAGRYSFDAPAWVMPDIIFREKEGLSVIMKEEDDRTGHQTSKAKVWDQPSEAVDAPTLTDRAKLKRQVRDALNKSDDFGQLIEIAEMFHLV